MAKLKIQSFSTGALGCNCSIIYSDESKQAIIIDPGDDELNIISKVEKLGLQVVKLLHTHAHFDHIGCSKNLKHKLGCSMHLHQGDEQLYQALSLQRQMFAIGDGDGPGVIDSWLLDEEEFSLDEEFSSFLKTLYTPGHTEGSCCFYTEYFEKPILFAGDTLFQQSIGRTDLPGGDFEKIKKSIKQRLYLLPDETRVITGHGQETSIFQEKRSNPFIQG
jgi:hydroxyacylglutathione hydrolase